ncbi:hypothetical protein SDC9_152863 [bioreactor metagenome]|uniref:Uncharacterized protein n=1 Tax=bioreactor metagenome TaxID=1076179 RepID=A0A645EWK8_9ZZZZ
MSFTALVTSSFDASSIANIFVDIRKLIIIEDMITENNLNFFSVKFLFASKIINNTPLYEKNTP